MFLVVLNVLPPQELLDGDEYSGLVVQLRDLRERQLSVQAMLNADPANSVLVEMQMALQKSIATVQKNMAELLLS